MVIENVANVEAPAHTGVVTLFKVTDGFGVTVTVAVRVKVELLQPFKATDMVVSTDAIDTKDIVVLVVKAGVVMVPEVP